MLGVTTITSQQSSHSGLKILLARTGDTRWRSLNYNQGFIWRHSRYQPRTFTEWSTNSKRFYAFRMSHVYTYKMFLNSWRTLNETLKVLRKPSEVANFLCLVYHKIPTRMTRSQKRPHSLSDAMMKQCFKVFAVYWLYFAYRVHIDTLLFLENIFALRVTFLIVCQQSFA